VYVPPCLERFWLSLTLPHCAVAMRMNLMTTSPTMSVASRVSTSRPVPRLAPLPPRDPMS